MLNIETDGTAAGIAARKGLVIGRLTEAARRHLLDGETAAAEALYRVVLDIEPRHAGALERLGILASRRGAVEEAATLFERAAAVDTGNATLRFNLGCLLDAAGRGEEALLAYAAAIMIKPDHAEAHLNLGNALLRRDQIDRAIDHFRRALAARPAYVEAHNNLGRALERQGRREEARAAFGQALAERQDYRPAMINLAAWHMASEDFRTALSWLTRALAITPSEDAKAMFVACIGDIEDIGEDADLALWLARAIGDPWGRPRVLADAGWRLVKRRPEFSACLAKLGTAEDLATEADFASLAADPLVLTLLRSAPACDVEVERVLTAARRALLACAGARAGDFLEFRCAVAMQCAINEYVHCVDGSEAEAALNLRWQVQAALDEAAPISAASLMTVASYFPLASLAGAERLLSRVWPPSVQDIIAQQVEHAATEREIAAAMPILTEITDSTSRAVRSQYEENPYPRWIKPAPAGEATSVLDWLGRTYPNADLSSFGEHEGAEILIVGCGTGQHAIETARKFPRAKILAVDLSRASLAYAMRQTRALGLSNVTYAQADLLQLGSLDRRFDLIESSGVLHHLADPLAGWRVLAALLRPGGLMRLGFYSERARADVVAGRAFVASRGRGATAEDIRKIRQEILRSFDPVLRNLTRFRDFFSTSECRDLLFHIQEHRLTLPQIEANLAELRLDFLGFVLDAATVRRFHARHPDPRTATDLGAWHRFECDYPETFSAMYQFWAQSRPKA